MILAELLVGHGHLVAGNLRLHLKDFQTRTAVVLHLDSADIPTECHLWESANDG